MFRSHHAKILIVRREPLKDFNQENTTRSVLKLFESLTLSAIKEDLISAKSPSRKSSALSKIKKEADFEMRLKAIKPFLHSWNKWRSLYFDVPTPVSIKSSSQLTMAENALAFLKENNRNTDIAIACLFKLYKMRKYKLLPNFSALKTMPEIYEELYDKALADIEEMIYKEQMG
jgi:hypothetical protein